MPDEYQRSATQGGIGYARVTKRAPLLRSHPPTSKFKATIKGVREVSIKADAVRAISQPLTNPLSTMKAPIRLARF